MIQYTELINSYCTDAQEINQYNLYFKTYFIHFCSQQILKHPLYDHINFNWKIHLSIHPQDMEKAWLLIYPILFQYESYFKIANLNSLTTLKNHREKRQLRMKDEYQQFLSHYSLFTPADLRSLYMQLYSQCAVPQKNHHPLIAFFHTLYTQLQCLLRLGLLNKKELFLEVQTLYHHLIADKQKALTNSNRLINGMQYTLYIVPGEEQKHCQLLEVIERRLLNAGIKPGIIFPTDRSIGIYSSIRHPGTQCYHAATCVESYNPDKVNDPFPRLSSLSIKIPNSQKNIILRPQHLDQRKTLLLPQNPIRMLSPAFFNIPLNYDSPRVASSTKEHSFSL